MGNLGPLAAGLLKGMAQGRVQKQQREAQEPLNKLKAQELKIKLQQAKNDQLLNQLAISYLQGGQTSQQPTPESNAPAGNIASVLGIGKAGQIGGSTQFGDSFGQQSPDVSGPQQTQSGIADQMALSNMPPMLAAIIKKATGFDLIGAGNLDTRRTSEKRLTRQGDARIAETARNNLFNQTLNNLKFSRGYSEGSYKEVWNTEAGRMEKVWVPKYGGPSLDGRPALPGKPRETERRIPTDQLQFWVNPETLEAAAPGMTPNDANDKGFIRLTNEQQKSVGDFQSVFNLLDKMGTLMDEVFPETESFTGRIIGGTKRWVGAKAQTNEAAARLEKLIKGSMSKIIRAMGEKGTLSDGDVNRALNLFSRLYDDADVARSAFKELKGLFQANFRAVFGQPRIQSGEFETGKIYPGEGGTKAKYLGGGEWEIQ